VGFRQCGEARWAGVAGPAGDPDSDAVPSAAAATVGAPGAARALRRNLGGHSGLPPAAAPVRARPGRPGPSRIYHSVEVWDHEDSDQAEKKRHGPWPVRD
jgi:hypothetical protein